MTPLPPQLRPDHPSIAAAHARGHMALDLIRRDAAGRPRPRPEADARSACQRAADDSRLLREQDQAIFLVTADGPGGEPG